MKSQIDNLECEIWKDVVGYEGAYIVSNAGNVKRVKAKGTNERLVAKVPDRDGYIKVHLSRNGKAKKAILHRLVASAFIGPSKLEVDHINGIKTDNRVENLEYVTSRENQLRCKERIGTKSKLRGASWHSQNSKWQAEIRINNIRHYLGTFNTATEAHIAYMNKLNSISLHKK